MFLVAGALAAAGCATSGAVPKPFPGAIEPPPASGSAGAGRLAPEALVRTALSLRGAPYRDGGSDPGGFDCSGFVQYVFAHHGVALPREVRDQYPLGRRRKLSEASAGDLIFFTTVARGVSHVGVMVGGDAFVHAPSTEGVVRVEHYRSAYWARRVVAVKRVP